MTFDTLVYNMGKIIEGGPNLKKEIYFTNTGNEPLIISRASTGDGGSMATWEKEPVMPGKRGKITFIYDTKRIGPFDRSIWIESNSYNNQNIRVKGEVVHKPTKIKASHMEINLGEIPFDSIREFQFYVKNSGKENLYFRFDSYCYYEIDLLSMEMMKSNDSSQAYGYNVYTLAEDSILIKGQVINLYGNSGKFNRKLNFIYNSYDTLTISLYGKFTGEQNTNKLVRNFYDKGYQKLIYDHGKIAKLEVYTFNKDLRQELYFESSNCSQLIEYYGRNNQKSRELFFKNGKVTEEKKYNVGY